MSKLEPEVLPSAIGAICEKFKSATDVYCREYPQHGMFSARFERAVRAYDSRKRAFNGAVEAWLRDFKELPDWAKEALAYQTERGFLDPLWKTWEAK